MYIENIENFFIRNHWTDFNIIWQNILMVTLYQDYSRCQHGHQEGVGGGMLIFPIYLYRKLQKSSCQIPMEDFNITWLECSFGDLLSSCRDS